MPNNGLSIGKIRGLQKTTSSAGIFGVLAFDQRQSLMKMLDGKDGSPVSYERVAAVKSDVVQALAGHATAVLLDPIYAAGQTIANGTLPGTTGLLVAVEETGYVGESTARRSVLLDNWSVRKIKRMGADAVKLLIYYHPDAGEITELQESLSSEVIEACAKEDIPCYLEAVIYSTNPNAPKGSVEFSGKKPELMVNLARRLGALKPEVLKIEFPVDVNHEPDEAKWREATRALSEASPVPWALLSAGVDFDVFARQVEVACQEGASGFIGGRAIWKEGILMSDIERQIWLRDVAAKRLDTLREIAEQYARPWTDFYPPQPASAFQDWYQSYGEP